MNDPTYLARNVPGWSVKDWEKGIDKEPGGPAAADRAAADTGYALYPVWCGAGHGISLHRMFETRPRTLRGTLGRRARAKDQAMASAIRRAKCWVAGSQ